MKVLFQVDSNTAFHHEMVNWARVFKAIECEVTVWDEATKPAFDVFDEFKPDLFIYEGGRYDGARMNKLVDNFKDVQFWNIDKPDYAANILDYKKVEPDPTIASKLLYINTYPGAEQPTEYILPLCHPVGKHSIKIFDIQPWSVCQYMGSIDPLTACRAMCSTQVLITSFDPEENLPECVYNARSLGVRVVNCQDYEIPGFEDAVRHGTDLVDPDEQATIDHDREDALDYNSYFHRVGEVLGGIMHLHPKDEWGDKGCNVKNIWGWYAEACFSKLNSITNQLIRSQE